MSVIAEFQIPSEQFVLGEVLDGTTDAYVELERVVPTSQRVMPFFWVQSGDPEGFERQVRESDVVDTLVALDRVEDRVLYRVTWTGEVHSLIYGISESNASILEAYGNDDWVFRIRFDNHAGLTKFHNYCTDHDIDFELLRVYTLTEDQGAGFTFDLTPEQRKALVLAVEHGYFEVPRRTTLGDVAGELNISQQATSERIRRAADKVLRKALLNRSARDF